MNPPKCTRNDFIKFLIAIYQACSCTNHPCVKLLENGSFAHDSVKRLSERRPTHTEALYEEAKSPIRLKEGVLIIDDNTLDKPPDEGGQPALEREVPPAGVGNQPDHHPLDGWYCHCAGRFLHLLSGGGW